ncbi:MAG: acyl-CoA carboxylase subunit epsilon, partial [Mycobacteriales bacterium]
MNEEKAAPPVLRVVRGTASPEELAAVVAVLTSRGGAAVEQPAPAPSRWNWRAHHLRS